MDEIKWMIQNIEYIRIKSVYKIEYWIEYEYMEIKIVYVK